jgi:ribonuclease T1
MRHVRFLMVILLALLAAVALWKESHGGVAAGDTPVPQVAVVAPADPPARVAVDASLPPEVAETLALIASGGPYPYDRDGLVFSNFEGHLPARARGWYHEYTVPTPGLDHRGARRIVTGGEPPSEYWYTDDHYESFRRLPGNP